MYEYKYNRNITIHQALKSLTCLYYQCSDAKDYLTNSDLELMKKLRYSLMEALISMDTEYKNAKWGA